MTSAAPTRTDSATPEELHPRHVAIRVAEITAVIAVVAIAIAALPGLDDVRARLGHASVGWVVALVLAEVGSCIGYLLAFRSTFCPQMSWRLSWDIAMSEQAANSLLPAGGAGGLALGVWALRQAGMPVGHIGRRTVAFFVVTSAANFVTLVVVGIAVFVGALPGHPSVWLTLVPALITALGVALGVLSPRLLRALGTRGAGPSGSVPSSPVHAGWRQRATVEVRKLLTAGADGVEQALTLLRSPRGLGATVGSFAYMGFDIVALGFAFAAVGPVPTFGVLVLGYLIGQLGNLIPLPGGVGGTEGALIGIFLLYGANLTTTTAAVLTYRLIQLVIPIALGAPAFVLLRRRLMRDDQPAVICAPLGADELPVFDVSGRIVT